MEQWRCRRRGQPLVPVEALPDVVDGPGTRVDQRSGAERLVFKGICKKNPQTGKKCPRISGFSWDCNVPACLSPGRLSLPRPPSVQDGSSGRDFRLCRLTSHQGTPVGWYDKAAAVSFLYTGRLIELPKEEIRHSIYRPRSLSEWAFPKTKFKRKFASSFVRLEGERAFYLLLWLILRLSSSSSKLTILGLGISGAAVHSRRN